MLEHKQAKELIPCCRWCFPENPPALVLKEDQDTTNKLCPTHTIEMKKKILDWQNDKRSRND
jgi:hypothetical protein